MGTGVWGKAETLKSPTLEAGVRNLGLGWGGGPSESVPCPGLKPREGSFRKKDTNSAFQKGN